MNPIARLFPLLLVVVAGCQDQSTVPTANRPSFAAAAPAACPATPTVTVSNEAGLRTAIATAAGLDPEPVALEASGSMWEAIEAVADAGDATVVVCGTDRSGVRSALPGHLAQALVAHISRPVLVVPSPRAAEERRHEAAAKKRRHPAFAT